MATPNAFNHGSAGAFQREDSRLLDVDPSDSDDAPDGPSSPEFAAAPSSSGLASLAWPSASSGRSKEGLHAERLAHLGREVLRLSALGPLYLNCYGELEVMSSASASSQAVEMDGFVLASSQGAGVDANKLDIERFLDLAGAMAQTIHSLNEKGVFLRVTSTDCWMISRPSPDDGSAGPSTAATRSGQEVPYLRLSQFVLTAVDQMTLNVRPEALVGFYTANIAPELVRGTVVMSQPHATEVYTLCATLYHMLTGHHCHSDADSPLADGAGPHKVLEGAHAVLTVLPTPPSSYRDDIPLELEQILLKGLEKQPGHRYMNCLSLAMDLDKLRKAIELGGKAGRSRGPLLRVGATDTVARLAFPERLFGLDGVEAGLAQALARAAKGGSALVRVVGASGTGKTSVVERTLRVARRSENGRTAGILVSVGTGRHPDQSSAVLADFLDELLRPLLLTQANGADDWQAEIPRLVGDTALPAFGRVLGPHLAQAFGITADSSSDHNITPATWEAVGAAILRIVRRLAAVFKPVVLFFDDAQRLDSDLLFVEALARSVADIPGLCLVCAHRPRSSRKRKSEGAFFKSALHALLATEAISLSTRPLSPPDLQAMLLEILGPPLAKDAQPSAKRSIEIADLAGLVDVTGGSSPATAKDLLLSMRDADPPALTFNYATEQWDFDRAAASHDSMALEVDTQALPTAAKTVLDATTPFEQALLVAASCIIEGGPFSVGLLAAATGASGPKTQSAVISLVRRKILVPAVAFADDAAPSDESTAAQLRFTHDSLIGASLALCAPPARAATHYEIAMRLRPFRPAHVNIVALNLQKAIEAGYQLNEVERADAISLLLDAGLAHQSAGQSARVISVLEACSELLGPTAWDHDHRRMRLVHSSLYEAYIMNGRPADALAVAGSMVARSRDEVEEVTSARLKMAAAAAIDPLQGMQILRGVMRKHLSVDLDQMASKEELVTRDVFREKAYSPDLGQKLPSDLEAALHDCLAEGIHVCYSSGPTHGIATALCAIDLARRHGSSQISAVPMMGAALFCCEAMNFESGRKWREEGSELAEKSEAPLRRVAAEMSKHASSHFFLDSWHDAADGLLHAVLLARDLAMYKTAASGLGHTFAAGFWSSMRLRKLVEAGQEVAPVCQGRVPHVYVFAAIGLQAVSNLVVSNPDGDPTVLAGLSQEAVRALPMYNNQWIAFELALHAIFKRPLWPVWKEQRSEHINTGALPSNFAGAFLGTLAILEAIRDGSDVSPQDHDFVAQIRRRFDAFVAASDCKHEFSAMQRILRAAEAALDRPFVEVLEAFDEAIDGAASHSLYLLEGLACERAASYILRGSPTKTRLAQGYLVQAYEAYRSWGALVKTRAMRSGYPFLERLEERPRAGEQLPASPFSRPAESTTTKSSTLAKTSTTPTTGVLRQASGCHRQDKDSAPNGSVTSTKEALDQARRDTRTSIDVASLLAAAHSWQTGDRDARSMVLSLIKVLLQQSGARFGAIALLNESGLVLKAAGSATSLRGDLDLPITDPKAAHLVPVSILDYVARTGQVAGLKELNIVAEADVFFVNSAVRPAAMFACPIRFESRVRGVIYFDSPLPSAFSATDRTIIASLANQAVLALERTIAAEDLDRRIELELKIAERTAELSRQNIELDQARKTAVDAKDAETRFLLRMSHELRTPSNSIIVLADLLQEAPLSGLHKEYLTQIKHSSRDLLAILSDVLDFSRISTWVRLAEQAISMLMLRSGAIVINPAAFDVRDMVEISIAGVAEQASTKGLELCYTNTASEDLRAQVIGDQFRCRQILLNLLSNAIKFTERPGFVSVTTSTRQTAQASSDRAEQIELRIDVVDNGIGISKEKQLQLFQSFSQVHSGKHVVGGSGLGLAISRALAQRMGGNTTARGELGVGSTFTVKVIVDVGPVIDPPLPCRHFYQRPDRRRVLISAPPLITRATLRRTIADFGAQAEEVSSVRKLDQRLAEEPFDFVVIDPLSAVDEDVECLNALPRHPYVGLIVIGNTGRCKERPSGLLDDPRTLVLNRPSKLRALHEAFVTLSDLPTPSRGLGGGLEGLEGPKLVAASVSSDGLPDLGKECPLSILIVDDNAVNRLVFKRLVERLGYRNPDFAVDGVDAVKICAARRFDLCLMDEQMPNLNGTQAMHKIRKEHADNAPFIAMVTASAGHGDKERALRAGFQAFLGKPLLIPELMEVIRAAHRRLSAV